MVYLLDVYSRRLHGVKTNVCHVAAVHHSYGYYNLYKNFCQLFLTAMKLLLPPAARGALFEKTAPLDPLQKLLINFIGFRVRALYCTHD
jgi:hypothetical protein